MRFITLSLCLVGILADLSACSPIAEIKTINYRLNTDVEPLDYIVDVTPYFEDSVNGKEPFTFDGICVITLKARQSNVDTITLHKQDLDIVEQSLTKKSKSTSSFSDGNDSIAIKSTDYNDITTIYTLKLATPLVKNTPYVLRFKYIGKLQTNMHGLYRSSYLKGNVTT